MGKYLAPLWVFILGQFVLLFLWLFMPATDAAVAELKTETAGTLSTMAWGWDWLMTNGVVRMLIYVLWELIIFFVAGLMLYKAKD